MPSWHEYTARKSPDDAEARIVERCSARFRRGDGEINPRGEGCAIRRADQHGERRELRDRRAVRACRARIGPPASISALPVAGRPALEHIHNAAGELSKADGQGPPFAQIQDPASTRVSPSTSSVFRTSIKQRWIVVWLDIFGR